MLKDSLIKVRDEMLAWIAANPDPNNPVVDSQGNPRPPEAWDINSGRCPVFAMKVKALEPQVNVISMTTLPDCDRFLHMVLEKDGVYYDAEHVDGCDLDELCRAYDTPRQATGGYQGSRYER
jgi:hypothetical protein